MKPLVYVLDSPSPDQAYIGQLPGQPIKTMLDFCGIESVYRLCLTVEALSSAIEDCRQSAISMQRIPVLHFGMHGNETGIAIQGREIVSWSQLRNLLRPILRDFNGLVLLCMQSCQGRRGAVLAYDGDEDPPYFALVGSESDIYTIESALAYAVFYSHLSRGALPYVCVDAMNAAYGEPAFTIIAGPSERVAMIFDQEAGRLANRPASGDEGAS